MRKIVLFMHTSLDGFVGGPNGEMNWIIPDPKMFEYASQQTDLADTALYGRVTYEMMNGYWPTAADQPNASKHDIEHSKWYKGVTKVVLSTTMKNSNLEKTKIISENISIEINKLKQESGRNILIFGSPRVAHSLMEENLIDEYWLFINPILLGNGIPLFKNIKSMTKLKLMSTKAFDSGVVGSNYLVVK
jgi:dihydrofolate reductase